MLHLDKERDVFPTVESIVVYPSAYKVRGARAGGRVVTDQVGLRET
jgi:hypothetical protein